jgi:hypothetical protein
MGHPLRKKPRGKLPRLAQSRGSIVHNLYVSHLRVPMASTLPALEASLEASFSMSGQIRAVFEQFQRKIAKFYAKLAVFEAAQGDHGTIETIAAVMSEAMTVTYWDDALTFYRMALEKMNICSSNSRERSLSFMPNSLSLKRLKAIMARWE